MSDFWIGLCVGLVLNGILSLIVLRAVVGAMDNLVAFMRSVGPRKEGE